jgi:acyl-coenzyme A synthetase/AMP-(fatty) acid ligase
VTERVYDFLLKGVPAGASVALLLPNIPQFAEALAEPPDVFVVGEPGKHSAYASMFEAGERAETDLHPIEDHTHVLTIYTSGTTGKPKGAVIDNANVVAQLDMIDSGFQFDVAATIDAQQSEHITIFAGVPTMDFYLLKFAPADAHFPKLRYCASGGSAMPTEASCTSSTGSAT